MARTRLPAGTFDAAAALLPELLGDSATPAAIGPQAKAYELWALFGDPARAMPVLCLGFPLRRRHRARSGTRLCAPRYRAAARPSGREEVLSALDTQLSAADKARAAHSSHHSDEPEARTAALAHAIRRRCTAAGPMGCRSWRARTGNARSPQARQRPLRRDPASQSAPSRASPAAVPDGPPIATAPCARSPGATLVPVGTIKRIAYRGGSGQNVIAGAFTREGSNAWVESNSSGRSFRYASIRNPTRESFSSIQAATCRSGSISPGANGSTAIGRRRLGGRHRILASVTDAHPQCDPFDRPGRRPRGRRLCRLPCWPICRRIFASRPVSTTGSVAPGAICGPRSGTGGALLASRTGTGLAQADCCVSGVVRP